MPDWVYTPKSGGGTTPTTLTLSSTTQHITLPASTNGIWRCFLVCQLSAIDAIYCVINNDTGTNYNWIQIANSIGGGSVSTFGAMSDTAIPINMDGATVTVKNGTDFYSQFYIENGVSTTSLLGKSQQTRSNGDYWYGNINGTYVPGTANTIYIKSGAGGANIVGSLIIYPE